MTAATFDLVAADGQTVTALISNSGGSVTIYEDSGCTTAAPEATVSAFESTETSRRFYVAAPGSYTLTVVEAGSTIYTGTVALSAAQTICGPYKAGAGQPASTVTDGGTP